MIHLTTFDEAKDAFRHRELRQALYDEGARLMEGVIVNLHGPAHIARRRLENRLFRRDTFAWYERERIPAIVDRVIAPAIASGRGELLELAKRTMMGLSVDVAGIDPTDDQMGRLFELMECLARASTVAHATGDKAAIVAAGDAALAEFAATFYAPALARRTALVDEVVAGTRAVDDLPRDVLTTLLLHADDLALPPETMLREIAYFPWVGSHSTSAQFVHAMHHLFEWIDEQPDDATRLADDDTLRQRFVHESMRLHPASPVALRIATTDTELKSGRAIPEGAVVTIDVEAANRDPAVFGDHPDRFDPFRPIAEGVAPWGLSFGHGTHACLGQELAGGIEPADELEHHLLGAVALMSGVALRAGARPDPDDPPSADPTTTRSVWQRYPVRFGGTA